MATAGTSAEEAAGAKAAVGAATTPHVVRAAVTATATAPARGCLQELWQKWHHSTNYSHSRNGSNSSVSRNTGSSDKALALACQCFVLALTAGSSRSTSGSNVTAAGAPAAASIEACYCWLDRLQWKEHSSLAWTTCSSMLMAMAAATARQLGLGQ